MIFIRIKFTDHHPDYAVIINTEENKATPENPVFHHTKSTWVQYNKQFDARLKDKLRKIRVMLVANKDLDLFLNSKGELPLGTLVAKEYGFYASEQSLLSLAALCDVSNFAKQFDAILNLACTGLDQAGISSNVNIEPIVKLNVQLQLFKEDDGPNKERMDWIKEFQLSQLGKGDSAHTNSSSNHSHSHSHTGRSSPGGTGAGGHGSGGAGGPNSNSNKSLPHSNLHDNFNDLSMEDGQEGRVRRGGHRHAMKRKKCVEHRQHLFLLTYFKQPSFCSVCRNFIWGIHQRQAYQCSLCQLAVHEKCIQGCMHDCRAVSNSIATREASASAAKERFNIDIPHNWKNKTFYKPTFCSHCGAMLIGLIRQGLQCRECERVCHIKCRDQISNDCGLNALMLMQEIGRLEETRKKKLTEVLKKDSSNYNEHEHGNNSNSTSSSMLPDSYGTIDQIDIEDRNMTDCLYNTLALTKTPDKLFDIIPSEYAHISKVLSKRSSPPPIPIAPNVPASQGHGKGALGAGSPNAPLIPARRESLHLGPNGQPAPPVPTRRNQNPPSAAIQKHISLKAKGLQPKFEDFKIQKVLGQGSFGKVLLANFKNSNKPVAIKALRKDATIDNNDVTATIVERDILAMGSNKSNCSFLASLICCFQDADRLYFVMEFLPGGDLMFHVQKKSRFRTHEARFYACQIACALEYLHNNKVVYRDLKLDNVLLDADGHCNLADFGMSWG